MPYQKLQQKFKKVKLTKNSNVVLSIVSEDWNIINLGDITKPITKGTTPTTEGQKFTKTGVPFFKTENIYDYGDIDSENCDFISNKTHQTLERSQLKENDILFSIAGTLGRVGIVKKNQIPSNTNQALSIIRLKNKKYDLKFLNYILNSKLIKNQILIQKTILAQANLSLEQVTNFLIPELKSELEQQKIASVLSNVDNSIQKITEQIEKSKNIKTGLMQKLLTKGIGHTKFKKVTTGLRYMVEEYPNEWEITTLGKKCKIERGKFGHRPRDDPEYYEGKYPFIQTGDVEKSKGYIISFSQTLNEKGLKVSKLFSKGVIVITIAAIIGSTAITTFPVCFPDSLIGISTNKMDVRFLEYFLRTRKNYLNVVSTVSAQKNINYETLKPLLIPNPPIDEQRKIASILSNVDSQIDTLESKKSQLQKTKRGLMQKLLTGQIRVRA